MFHVLHVVRHAGRRRAGGLDVHLDRHLAGLLKPERQREAVARFQRCLQADEHDVHSAGLQFDGTC